MEGRAKGIIKELKAEADSRNLDGMKRFGIATENALGVNVPKLRALAKRIGNDHGLAVELWDSGIHEAMMLATMIDDPEMVTERQMESWVREFHSWDVCDQCCGNLFDRTGFAYRKALEWPKRNDEYVRRAGFVMMACLAVHDRRMKDAEFLRFLPVIERFSCDERNFVKKAVNWALRQIGKRNARLNRAAIAAGKRISVMDSKSARWIASDALRELRSPQVKRRLHD